MTETVMRLLILALVGAVIGGAAWWGRGRTRGRPVPVTRPDLSAGVHLFASSSCASCEDARRVLKRVYGNSVSEVWFDDDPSGFGRSGINRVPTVFVLGEDGSGVMFEGVPRDWDLPRFPSTRGGDGP